MAKKKTFSADDVRAELRKRVERFESQKAFARTFVIPESVISDTLNGTRTTISPLILDVLGFEKVAPVVRYQKKFKQGPR